MRDTNDGRTTPNRLLHMLTFVSAQPCVRVCGCAHHDHRQWRRYHQHRANLMALQRMGGQLFLQSTHNIHCSKIPLLKKEKRNANKRTRNKKHTAVSVSCASSLVNHARNGQPGVDSSIDSCTWPPQNTSDMRRASSERRSKVRAC